MKWWGLGLQRQWWRKIEESSRKTYTAQLKSQRRSCCKKKKKRERISCLVLSLQNQEKFHCIRVDPAETIMHDSSNFSQCEKTDKRTVVRRSFLYNMKQQDTCSLIHDRSSQRCREKTSSSLSHAFCCALPCSIRYNMFLK